MNMIEMKRRTPEETKAYKDGFRAGVNMAIDAIKSNFATLELLWWEKREGENDAGRNGHE